MKRIEIRGVIVPSAYDCAWLADYIAKGLFTPESRIRAALAESNDDVELYINSQGGSVFAGNEMINALKQFKATGKKLEITVGAMAASMAANIVAMAGADRVRAFANSKFMFHGAYGLTEGGKGAHEDSAAMLASINNDVIAKLLTLPGAKKPEIKGWFEEGRMGWLSAKQALDLGLISEIADAQDAPIAAMDKEAAAKMLETSGLDVAALDFQEPVAETVSKTEFDALMARFTGLQSAKDKEITALKDSHAVAISDKDAQISALTSERNDFKAKFDTATADLGKVTADLSAEQGAHAKTKETLAATGEQLTKAQAQHQTLVGNVIGVDPEGKKTGDEKTGLARMIAAEKNENVK
jgi:ATP-dependent Clp protease, protease subunit